MDVTVTIASWNRADLLERCLRSLLETEAPVEVEIIVIDNASADGSVSMVREKFPSVRVIANRENRGFGPAHNQGIAEAQGRYILIMNNDAAVFPDTIPKLVKFMDEHPKAGIVTCPGRPSIESGWMTGGGMKYFPNLTREVLTGLVELALPPFDSAGGRPLVTLSQKINGLCEPSREQEVAWTKGALLLVRHTTLDQIKGFDERFFMYYEDVDICLQARHAGWSVWQTPATSYFHESGQSTALRSDREQMWSTSGFSYFRKNHGLLSGLLWLGQNYLIRRWLLGLRRSVGRALRGDSRLKLGVG